MAATQVNTKYVKLYDGDAKLLGITAYNAQIALLVGDTSVKLYDESLKHLGFSKALPKAYVTSMNSGVTYAFNKDKRVVIPIDEFEENGAYTFLIKTENNISEATLEDPNGVITHFGASTAPDFPNMCGASFSIDDASAFGSSISEKAIYVETPNGTYVISLAPPLGWPMYVHQTINGVDILLSSEPVEDESPDFTRPTEIGQSNFSNTDKLTFYYYGDIESKWARLDNSFTDGSVGYPLQFNSTFDGTYTRIEIDNISSQVPTTTMCMVTVGFEDVVTTEYSLDELNFTMEITCTGE